MELTKEMKTLAFINVATAIVIMCLTIWTALSLGFIGKDVAPLIIGHCPNSNLVGHDNLNALYALPVLFCASNSKTLSALQINQKSLNRSVTEQPAPCGSRPPRRTIGIH